MNEIQNRRNFFDSLGQNYPENKSVEIQHALINGVSCYWFIPEKEVTNKIIVHLHGGAFVMGSIQSYGSMISHFSAQLQTRILFVDYALAPEHPYPNAINDIMDVYERLISDYPNREIIFMGDSAGAGLTLSAIGKMVQQQLQLPQGVMMISPWINLTCDNASQEDNRTIDPILSKEYLFGSAKLYTGDVPFAISSPEYIEFDQFPPTLIMVGTNEVLLDDSKNFYNNIKGIQPNTTLSIYESQLHVWPLANVHSEAAQKAIAEMGAFLTALQNPTSTSKAVSTYEK
ncbi:alpha/beta hydrolase [Mucilaginibacter jinjuensis]|uniref:Alpha/beta hydrolase n=1 Tax=Mucilaginibacter jinjuensis TaxID=1176721 RepID=A0ABY7T8A8_9SPHI|nr:alpha/beta hydrolase [Mucilaginibacter jinjuensis]WCT12513.1 alpha/beta hydrolase [Mucilaginibacter jinjuensis]